MDEITAGTVKNVLNLIFMLDTSGSMFPDRINQLNIAMAEAVQAAEEAAAEMETLLFMRVITFSDHAQWLIGSAEHGVEHIDWKPLTAGGGTNTAEACDLACRMMHREILGSRNYKPVVILITDGESNEPDKTVAAIARLKASLKSATDPQADKIIRIAIGVKGANQSELNSFAAIGTVVQNEEKKENVPLVFDVNDIELLKEIVKNVTVSSIMSSIGAGAVDMKGGTAADPEPVVVNLDRKDDKDWIE